MSALMRHKQPPFTIYSDYTATIPEYFDEPSSYSQSEQHEQDKQKYEYELDARYSMSPSPYDADNGLSSDDNESVAQSIETTASMHGRQSSAAFTTISSIPPSLSTNSDISPYTPRKGPRPAFRSPSSVRAMQLASPPPFHSPRGTRPESPLSSNARRQRAGPPSSVRSGSVLHHTRHSQVYEDELSGHGSGRSTPIQTPTRGPLVLLHVTVLPCPGLPYSMESLQELAPAYVQRNWSKLQEKLAETVLSRGVLIPHPGEEFDLLEESLLETLELCAPRLGSCGHFYGGEQDSDSDSGNDSAVSDLSGDGSKVKALCARPHTTPPIGVEDDDICHDCDQPMRIPGRGIGSGNSRWDIKIYAANGLMRAGAWGAVWRDMERVDVEIEPWIPQDVRKALDIRLEQEEDRRRQQHEDLEKMRFEIETLEQLQREAEEEKNWLRSERARAEDKALALEKELASAEAAQALQQTQSAQRLATSPPPTSSLLVSEPDLSIDKKRSSIPVSDNRQEAPRSQHTGNRAQDIPLTTLLRNYITLLAQDRRNIALGLLSVLVVFLAVRLAAFPAQHQEQDNQLQNRPGHSTIDITQVGLGNENQSMHELYSDLGVPSVQESTVPLETSSSSISHASQHTSTAVHMDTYQNMAGGIPGSHQDDPAILLPI